MSDKPGPNIRKRRVSDSLQDEERGLFAGMRMEEGSDNVDRVRWESHLSFMSRLNFLIIFITGCVSLMIVFFLWSPSVPNNVIKEKNFFIFLCLPLFVLALLVMIFFRKDPKLNIFTLVLSSGIIGYTIGFVTVALFKSIEILISE